MNQSLLAPSKLLSLSWADYKAKAKKLAALMAVFYIIMGIVGLFVGGSLFYFSSSEPIFASGIIPFLIGGLIVLIAGLITEIALIRMAAGEESRVQEAYKRAWPRLLPFLGLSLLVGLTILVGFILIIIPGIIFAVWFGFSYFVFLLENTGIREAMKKSKAYVKGRFWAVLGRIVVLLLILLPFMIISSIADGMSAEAVSFVVDILVGLFVAPFSLV